ncbi:hypothetical protein MPTK1_1g29740 [Marchantia polymorpha subsp. ruderalis]|uniref:F-box domain-containing protein n=2 Tax=Marchantia polymorpha TaxID=3197 RepID=A0AAF6AVP0_MARPO|nr:hypothetical protein MARPO_0209s0010 [Marchantia polymorpha]BBN00511.1 hypothetical protein Mp_1g29740 [Marchantia polymorpha subsp. ruderalis]|eukprot:PTQ27285.1 hypothetical protein MARPO_0209s0010 [Marchantia polymorpha]
MMGLTKHGSAHLGALSTVHSTLPSRRSDLDSARAVPPDMNGSAGLDPKRGKSPDAVDALPTHIIEKIVSLIPFPSLLTARALSSYWFSSFSWEPPHYSSLQEQVRSVSRNWTTFCPTFVTKDHELIGFDKVRQQWTSLLPLTYFPLQSSVCQFSGYGSSLEGPLLCANVNAGSCCSLLETYFKVDLFITNVITREWKILPPRPVMQHPTHVQVLPSSTAGGYKVLTLTHPVSSEFEEGGSDLIQIYDSGRDAWELVPTDVTSSYLEDLGGVFLNDKYYVLYRNEEIAGLGRNVVIEHITVYDVHGGLCRRIVLDSLPLNPGNLDYEFGIVKVTGSVMLVVVANSLSVDEEHSACPMHHHNFGEMAIRCVSANSIMVFELNPETGDFKPVATGPPCLAKNVSVDQMIGHESRIYFAGCVPHSSVLFYDLQQNQWGCLPKPMVGVCSSHSIAYCFAFEPGLDPFVRV